MSARINLDSLDFKNSSFEFRHLSAKTLSCERGGEGSVVRISGIHLFQNLPPKDTEAYMGSVRNSFGAECSIRPTLWVDTAVNPHSSDQHVLCVTFEGLG